MGKLLDTTSALFKNLVCHTHPQGGGGVELWPEQKKTPYLGLGVQNILEFFNLTKNQILPERKKFWAT